MDLDLVITNGLIVDGTGRPGFSGNVGVKEGRIVYIGSERPEAAREFDASGRVVAPGFIDIHTHYDAQLVWDPMISVSPWHGVTTVIIGNCGFGIAPTRPEHRDLIVQTLERVEGMNASALRAGLGGWGFESFGEYLGLLESRGIAVNVAALLGHTPLRTYVMGREAAERAATEDEIASMRSIVRQGLADGAIGISSSRVENHVGYEGKPVPSRAASLEELDALVAELGSAGRRVLQITTGPDLFFGQFAELARRHDVTICWAALLADRTRYGLTPQAQLEQTRRLVREGLRIHPQVSARPVSFEMTMEEPFPFEQLPRFNALISGNRDDRLRAYSEPGFREAFRDAMDHPIDFLAGLPDIVITVCDTRPEFSEVRARDAAQRLGVHPADLVLDLALETDLKARFRLPLSNRDEALVARFLTDPNTVLGLSDAGAHASQLCDACMPTFLLQRWVREKGVVSLEAAVRMMTSWPAEIFGISDRGRLERGLAADIVVFDPDRVAAGPLQRVHDLPAGADRLISEAHGIDCVIVNGAVIRQGGTDVVSPIGQALPGRVLRNGRAQ
jgi:N-acyl-D-amino-acid deacylase